MTKLKRLSGFLLLLFSLGCVLYQAGFRINTGISYPSGLYQLTNGPTEYRKGDLVLFCPPDNTVMTQALERDYIKPGTCQGGFTPVIKRIMATAGDTVSFTEQVSINAVAVPGTRMLPHDNEGRPLPHPVTVTLATEQYFMMSDHKPAISFDSRYYGPVPDKNVIGHIHPVFTW